MGTHRLPEHYLQPQWLAPEPVLALVSTRVGGVSASPFQHFNLGLHVGDDPTAVLANREHLLNSLPASMHLQWLEQVHSHEIVKAQADGVTRRGDGVYVDQPGLAGVVMTADCLRARRLAWSGRRRA